MNYMGAYHLDVRPHALGICDAPHISKSRMTLCGYETASDAQGMALVFGRMRNRAALARRLDCAPYASQAQLALAAYARWGDDYVLQIEGPLMSCIADARRERMLIARDRMGETSVFYADAGGALLFADHPDMILKAGFVEPVVDCEGLCEIFGLGPARTPGKTPLKGLKSLESGCMVICEGDRLLHRRYFDLEARPHEDDPRATVARVRELMEQAVGDVVHLHPGCMLSGGIDSTALTALLCMRIGRVDSYSVDYADNAQDFVPNAFRPEMDAPYIRLAARVFGTRHHSVVLDQESLAEALGPAERCRGFPGMGDIDASLMLFAGQIARGTQSVISGECGDEVFGGYPWFRGDPQLPRDAFPWSGSLELRESVLQRPVAEKLRLREYVRDALNAAVERYDVSAAAPEERARFVIQRLCLDFFMPNLQERAARMCEAQGLSVLTPLCDDRLVRYVYGVPWEIKRFGGAEKGLLREAMRDLVPEKLRMRQKSPYPKTCSARYTQRVREYIREMCADGAAPIWRAVDPARVETLAASALNPADTPWYGQLMAGPQMLAYLWQVNCWMRERGVRIEI